MSIHSHIIKFTILLLMFASMSSSRNSSCPDCGTTGIPYPLSTGDNCGIPSYRIFCNHSQLYFRSEPGIFYPITAVDAASNSLVIRPPALASGECASIDFGAGGLNISDSSPFNISKRNTVMIFNCSETILLSPLNCSDNSLCHRFEDEMQEAKACKGKLCCTYLKDTSQTSRFIRLRKEGCSAYTSVVNINSTSPPSAWNYGVEIQWVPV